MGRPRKEADPAEVSLVTIPDSKTVRYLVSEPFRDKADFSRQYTPGEDVSHFDTERLADLISKHLIKADS